MTSAKKSDEKRTANYYLGSEVVEAVALVAKRPEVDISPSKLAARILKKSLEKEYGVSFKKK